jgi:methylmalonyl-CoA mutase
LAPEKGDHDASMDEKSAGGVIPALFYDFLYSIGASAIFGPGTVIPRAAEKVLEEIYERLGYEEVESSHD